MEPNTQRLIQGAAGAAREKIYVEDVFSTYLYTGNGSTQTITNDIDLAGEGGLVWIKGRGGLSDHILQHNTTQYLSSNTTAAASDPTSVYVTSFNSTGFSLGLGDAVNKATAPSPYASWTFRKQAKFFDVVTWTGSGASTPSIAHNLGVTPAIKIIKCTSNSYDWIVGGSALGGRDYYLKLNTTDAIVNSSGYFDADDTSTTFSIRANNLSAGGGSGETYVAYLFAHDAGGFGDSGNDSVVKCGSYTGNGSTNEINLGWEPQWILIKRSSGSAEWAIIDNMRGIINPSVSPWMPVLAANSSNTESFFTSSSNKAQLNPTGFTLTAAGFDTNYSGETYIYIAIRRGPMKTPTDATKVFALNAGTGTHTPITTNFPVDYGITTARIGSDKYAATRLTGKARTLLLNSTAAEVASADYGFESNTTFTQGDIGAVNSPVTWMFRRAPGYFDAVAYTGTGSARTVTHNLGVTPELMIVKDRSGVRNWFVWVSGFSGGDYLELNLNGAKLTGGNIWNSTIPTSTVFSVDGVANTSSNNFIAYLFATCPGVSKVGSYTGTGTTLSVDCGFTAGARLVLIKRTDSTGDWYIYDTARGIVSGDDPYLLVNSTAAEVTNTDYIDPLSSGFQISSTAPDAINANGGSFIFLAIA
jgi:hypothetical protein